MFPHSLQIVAHCSAHLTLRADPHAGRDTGQRRRHAAQVVHARARVAHEQLAALFAHRTELLVVVLLRARHTRGKGNAVRTFGWCGMKCSWVCNTTSRLECAWWVDSGVSHNKERKKKKERQLTYRERTNQPTKTKERTNGRSVHGGWTRGCPTTRKERKKERNKTNEHRTNERTNQNKRTDGQIEHRTNDLKTVNKHKDPNVTENGRTNGRTNARTNRTDGRAKLWRNTSNKEKETGANLHCWRVGCDESLVAEFFRFCKTVGEGWASLGRVWATLKKSGRPPCEWKHGTNQCLAKAVHIARCVGCLHPRRPRGRLWDGRENGVSGKRQRCFLLAPGLRGWGCSQIEIEEPIKSREKHYSLVLYILKNIISVDVTCPTISMIGNKTSLGLIPAVTQLRWN